MTNEKARDFFSAYHEGSLEPGLCVSFEQKLRSDHSLRDEYEAFVKTMDSLDVLKFEEISIPDDLHERISSRLDRYIYEQKRSARPSLGAWLRGLAFAGIGALAIVGALLAINGRNGASGAHSAGPLPTFDANVRYTIEQDGVTLKVAPNAAKNVSITNGGKEVSHRVVGDATTPELKMVLSNPLPTASVFGVQIEGDALARFVAVPGHVRSGVANGEGTVIDLAKALSDFFRMPVTLETRGLTDRAKWSFTTSDAVGEASKALGPNYLVTEMKGNLLQIEQRQ